MKSLPPAVTVTRPPRWTIFSTTMPGMNCGVAKLRSQRVYQARVAACHLEIHFVGRTGLKILGGRGVGRHHANRFAKVRAVLQVAQQQILFGETDFLELGPPVVFDPAACRSASV